MKLKRILSFLIAAAIVASTLIIFPVTAENPEGLVNTVYRPDWNDLASTDDAYSFYHYEGFIDYKAASSLPEFTEMTAFEGTAPSTPLAGRGVGHNGFARVFTATVAGARGETVGNRYINNNGANPTTVVKFTAPATGTYKTCITGIDKATNGNGYIDYIYGNPTDGYVGIEETAGFGNTNPLSLSRTVELKAGDEMLFLFSAYGTAVIELSEFSVIMIDAPKATEFEAGDRFVPYWNRLDTANDFFSFYNAGDYVNYTTELPELTELTALNNGTTLTNLPGNGLAYNGKLRLFVSTANSTGVTAGNVYMHQNSADGVNKTTVIKFTAPVTGSYTSKIVGSNKANNGNGAIFYKYGNVSDGYAGVAAEYGSAAGSHDFPSNGDQRTFGQSFELEAGDEILFLFPSYGTILLELNELVVTLTALAVEPEPEPVPSFTASISATPTDVSRGGSTTVKVTVGGNVYTKYNSGEITVAYDDTMYDFTSAKIGSTTLTANAENGKVEVGFFGSDNGFDTSIDLVFTAKNDVQLGAESTFTLESAAFSEAEAAVSADLVVADITTAEAKTKVVACTYDVELTSPETGLADALLAVEGNVSQATEEQDYVINLPEGHEAYVWTATVGDNTYTAADGKITVPADDITGEFTISVQRVSKTYTVTGSVVGDDLNQSDVFNGDPEAKYGEDYIFSVPEAIAPNPVTGESGISYSATIVYTGTENAVPYSTRNENGEIVYVIAGANVTADITVSIVKTVTAVNQYTVTVNGYGADVSGSETTTVNENQPFSFTITPISGYDYNVTAEGATITQEGNTYTIASVTSNVTVTVTRTVNTDGVAIYSYLDLNGKTVYAVTVTTTLGEGYGYTYDGNAMFYNAENGEYIYLVIVEDTFTVDDAKAKVGILAGAQTVTYNENGVDTDVNVTGKTDANDAQLIYNVYSTKAYDNFDALPMLKLLLCDVNCDRSVNVDDAQTVISSIVEA